MQFTDLCASFSLTRKLCSKIVYNNLPIPNDGSITCGITLVLTLIGKTSFMTVIFIALASIKYVFSFIFTFKILNKRF